MPIESEIKARLRDREALRRAIRRLGGRVSSRRTLEDNFVLDDGGKRLYRRAELLRVRFSGPRGRALLTWKGRADGGREVKSREELEVECGDGTRLLEILGRLGLAPVLRYQRYRETWRLGQVEVMIDETPAGDFVEIEGKPGAVARVRKALAIAPADLVAESYPALFLRLLAGRGDRSREVVFR